MQFDILYVALDNQTPVLHPSTVYLSLIMGLICGVDTPKIKGRVFMAGSLFKCGTCSKMLIIFKQKPHMKILIKEGDTGAF